MATIKSFTDISQSKTLSKILPLESADMLWGYYFNGKNHCVPNIRPFRDGRNEIPKCYIPAWSLAALLSVLPEGVIENYYAPNLQKEKGKYSIAYGNEELLHVADNPVDACYELILKLKELNLL